MAEEFKRKSSSEVFQYLKENGVPDMTCDEFEGMLCYYVANCLSCLGGLVGTLDTCKTWRYSYACCFHTQYTCMANRHTQTAVLFNTSS